MAFLQYALERGALLALARVISRSKSPFPLLIGWIQMIPLLSEQFYQQAIDPLMQFVAIMLGPKGNKPPTDEDARTLGYELYALVKSVDRLQDGEFSLTEAAGAKRSKSWAGREHAHFQLFALSIDSFKHRFAFPTVLEGIIFDYWYVPWWIEGSWICDTCTLQNVRGTVACTLCLKRRAKEMACEDHLQPAGDLKQIFAHVHNQTVVQQYPIRHPVEDASMQRNYLGARPGEPRFVTSRHVGRKVVSSSESDDDTPPAYR